MKNTRSCRGFTLVELLVAMALSTLLIWALMSVASSAAGDAQRLRDQEEDREPQWFEGLVRQVESDFLMGTGVSHVVYIQGRGSRAIPTVYLSTYAGGDEGSGHPLPVLVSYQLIQAGEHGVLVRHQRPMTRPEGVATPRDRRVTAQVMAIGVQEVTIGGATLSLEPEAVTQPLSPERDGATFTILIENRPVTLAPIPAQINLQLVEATHAESSNSDSPRESPATYHRTLVTQ